MEPRLAPRLEGLAVLATALAVYAEWTGPLWLLLVLALAPDLSMVGHLAGSRIGSATYDHVHTFVLPLALGGVGWWLDAPPPLAALVDDR